MTRVRGTPHILLISAFSSDFCKTQHQLVSDAHREYLRQLLQPWVLQGLSRVQVLDLPLTSFEPQVRYFIAEAIFLIDKEEK